MRNNFEIDTGGKRRIIAPSSIPNEENEMPENLKELLKRVFSCDTEAGERLRYHIMRALACKEYAKEINFLPEETDLICLFFWASTPEGIYWNQIDLMVR